MTPSSNGDTNMVIGLDIDGCFADFVSSYADLCEARSGKPVSKVATCWNWVSDTEGVSQADVSAVWQDIKSDPYWWACLGSLPEAEEALILLNYFAGDHDLYFITNRPAGAKFYTEEWLRRFGLDHPTVILAVDKGLVAAALGLDVYLDDKAENVTAVRDALPSTSRVYIQTQPYNLDYEKAGVTPVTSPLALFTFHERLS